jgi:hypothetical protein
LIFLIGGKAAKNRGEKACIEPYVMVVKRLNMINMYLLVKVYGFEQRGRIIGLTFFLMDPMFCIYLIIIKSLNFMDLKNYFNLWNIIYK